MSDTLFSFDPTHYPAFSGEAKALPGQPAGSSQKALRVGLAQLQDQQARLALQKGMAAQTWGLGLGELGAAGHEHEGYDRQADGQREALARLLHSPPSRQQWAGQQDTRHDLWQADRAARHEDLAYGLNPSYRGQEYGATPEESSHWLDDRAWRGYNYEELDDLADLSLSMPHLNMQDLQSARLQPGQYPGAEGMHHSKQYSRRLASLQQRPPPSQQGAGPCRYYQGGYCKHGERCKFSHATALRLRHPADRLPSPDPSWPPAPPGHQRQLGPRGLSDSGRYPASGHQLGADRRWSWSGEGPDGGAGGWMQGLGPWAKDGTLTLDDLRGSFVQLCKDQHGCRFLQGRLEERAWCNAICSEALPHLPGLMIDPFGNYLCQKLVECCTGEQLRCIVETVAPHLVAISLNMHGTRAAQKLVEHLADSYQIELVVRALRGHVVGLIKDLNGNHVVQRCLQRLPPPDNQFICDAVAAHCVEVATHRHGCCVMQRCIDYASDRQRVQLVTEVTFNALSLIQDPYGNYVVQYVLELANPRFSDALVRQFLGHISQLAVQKFSSNVIEKCLHVAERDTRNSLIDELMDQRWLPRLLQDPFGNYVIQTALSIAEGPRYTQLVESIRPYLGMIGHLPYGKKIQYRIAKDDRDRPHQKRR